MARLATPICKECRRPTTQASAWDGVVLGGAAASACAVAPSAAEQGSGVLLLLAYHPEALGERINWLVSDAECMKAMGASGQQRVHQYFMCDKVADGVLEVYHTVL